MRASMALLGQLDIGLRGRRIAVLGDMLELGPAGPEMHAALAASIIENNIDLVYAAGPLMRSLWDALPHDRKGGYAATAAELQPTLLPALQAGDAVMVKGSLGSRMGPVVAAMKSRYPLTPRERFATEDDGRLRQARCIANAGSGRFRQGFSRIARCCSGWLTTPRR